MLPRARQKSLASQGFWGSTDAKSPALAGEARKTVLECLAKTRQCLAITEKRGDNFLLHKTHIRYKVEVSCHGWGRGRNTEKAHPPTPNTPAIQRPVIEQESPKLPTSNVSKSNSINNTKYTAAASTSGEETRAERPLCDSRTQEQRET